MNYIIMNTVDTAAGMGLALTKIGNEYRVEIHHEREHSAKTFKTLDDAYRAYERIAYCIAFGLYSVQQRREMLNEQ